MSVFIDHESETFNIYSKALKLAVKDRISKVKKLKAIIVIQIYEIADKIDEVLTIADEYQISILEENAESIRSSTKGKVWYFSDINVILFSDNKIITTSGDEIILTK
nr:DegT/DnrJ/EryC1/StrS family aminotransferase [Flavobacterium sp. ASV13]